MTNKRMLIIANPTARHGESAALIPVVQRLLESAGRHRVALTQYPGHAQRIARAADGYDLVVAMGGDGTVHEVLNGLMGLSEKRRPALSLLPTGSGNDWRRILDISADLPTAVNQVLTGVRRRIDIGTCNGTYFANSFSVGLDARVTAKAIEMKVTTERSGLGLYYRAALEVLLHDFGSWRLNIAKDGAEPAEHDVLMLAATIGRTYGGGFKITPDAIDDDGLLEVCVIDRLPLASALWRLPLMAAGKHRWMSVVHLERHQTLSIHAPGPVPAQMDGEVLLGDDYEIGIVPAGLEVVVPRPA